MRIPLDILDQAVERCLGAQTPGFVTFVREPQDVQNIYYTLTQCELGPVGRFLLSGDPQSFAVTSLTLHEHMARVRFAVQGCFDDNYGHLWTVEF